MIWKNPCSSQAWDNFSNTEEETSPFSAQSIKSMMGMESKVEVWEMYGLLSSGKMKFEGIDAVSIQTINFKQIACVQDLDQSENFIQLYQ